MADKSLKPKTSWTPMVAFFGVVVGVVVLLWWMSRPAASTESTGSKSAATASAPMGPMGAGPTGAPGAPPSMKRELCSVADVKRFIASQLASDQVPDDQLQQVAAQVMAALTQAGVAEKGCVSPADVTAALYDMVNDEDEGSGN